MVLKVEPIALALDDLRRPESRVILLSAQGAPFCQATAKRLAAEKHLVMLSGHYEGVDQRVADHLADEEISLGDYVLTNGTLAALVVTDAVVRLLPGVLGDEQSAADESFSQGLLEYPHYTRPAEFRGWKVPDVLLSGNHAVIEAWRRAQAVARTQERRPDLGANP
jgi:tRNA (guanine37-N1)-methyltransferase